MDQDRRVWNSLVTTNEYGECAARDVEEMVTCFLRILRGTGAELEMKPVAIVRQILNYLVQRSRKSCLQMPHSRRSSSEPADWTDYHEGVWMEWLDKTFDEKQWHTEVLDRVFGSDRRIWEAPIEGWREDITTLLPFWVRRSMAIVEKEEPFLIQSESEGSEEEA